MQYKLKKIAEAILVNEEGEILLQKKTLDYGYHPGGPWCFFGGAVEGNETPEDALKREINEEISYKIKDFELFSINNCENGSGEKRKIYTFIVPFDGQLSRISLREGAGFGIFSCCELGNIYLIEHCRRLLKEYFKKRN